MRYLKGLVLIVALALAGCASQKPLPEPDMLARAPRHTTQVANLKDWFEPSSAYGFGGGGSSGGGGGGAPTGAAGGDLGGIYPNPTVVSGGNLGAGTVPNAALVTAPLTAASTLDTTKLSSAAIPTGVTGSPTLAVTNFTGALPTALTGSPAIALTNVTGTLPTGSTAALTGDVTKSAGSNAATAISSSNLQQPVMFIGSSTAIQVTGTTLNPSTPTGTANGDLEVMVVMWQNATPGALTCPTNWTAASCSGTASGNSGDSAICTHTASSEGGTTGAVSWANSVATATQVLTYRNATLGACDLTTAASSTTANTDAITATSVKSRVLNFGYQPGVNKIQMTTPIKGMSIDAVNNNNVRASSFISYPISSTTVAAQSLTSNGAAVWVLGTIDLAFAASSTASGAGALTVNQYGAALNSLILGGGSIIQGGAIPIVIQLPNTIAIGCVDSTGIVRACFYVDNASQLIVGSGMIKVDVPVLLQVDSGINNGTDTINSWPRMPLMFNEGPDASLAANESLGTFLTPKAITIENITLDIKTSPTCSVSEQITCYDCGTSAGACTSSQTSTIMSAITIASGATRQSIAESINTANVAAAHYISCLITAGTCTVSNNAITMMARPQ